MTRFPDDMQTNREVEAARPSFWLFADNSVDLASNLKKTGRFLAYLKHALLFHEKLLLSDSLVVNTPNLRRVLQLDPDLTGC